MIIPVIIPAVSAFENPSQGITRIISQAMQQRKKRIYPRVFTIPGAI
jgi:hypothetical protein